MMTKKKCVVQKENIENRTKGNTDKSKKYHRPWHAIFRHTSKATPLTTAPPITCIVA